MMGITFILSGAGPHGTGLYRIDPKTNQASKVGPFGIFGLLLTDLVWHHGELYGVGNLRGLWRVDKDTGQTQQVWYYDLDFTDLVSDCRSLYALSTDNKVYRLYPNSSDYQIVYEREPINRLQHWDLSEYPILTGDHIPDLKIELGSPDYQLDLFEYLEIDCDSNYTFDANSNSTYVVLALVTVQSGALTITPIGAGTALITITVNYIPDPNFNLDLNFTVTVSTAGAPGPGQFDEFNPATVHLDETLQYDLTDYFNGHGLNYYTQVSTEGIVTTQITNGILTITPVKISDGITMTVYAYNDSGNLDRELKLTVLPEQAPGIKLDLPDLITVVGESNSIRLPEYLLGP